MFLRYDGPLYRIVFASRADQVLDGVISPEARFHHSGQPALYASPLPASAALAIDIYLQPEDPPRVLQQLHLVSERIVDLRDPDTCATLEIEPDWPSVIWRSQRDAGQPATSWRASDAARRANADGMIYASRRAPSRWHMVLFHWNTPEGAQLTTLGAPEPWAAPNQT
ncbi:RES family NAD+ phosphorylase [Flavimaricola marinus]|uniref:RES domain protein n=1 Tax=Flavimaricola marinus TaxID=1819565 RepID=A0A238L8D6_9RHOB|nr:RES family NAD+ phosphorylase [Flavimaricola marinus]SMY05928.1 RES domain protein [Flavimaricola marinus]